MQYTQYSRAASRRVAPYLLAPFERSPAPHSAPGSGVNDKAFGLDEYVPIASVVVVACGGVGWCEVGEGPTCPELAETGGDQRPVGRDEVAPIVGCPRPTSFRGPRNARPTGGR